MMILQPCCLRHRTSAERLLGALHRDYFIPILFVEKISDAPFPSGAHSESATGLLSAGRTDACLPENARMRQNLAERIFQPPRAILMYRLRSTVSEATWKEFPRRHPHEITKNSHKGFIAERLDLRFPRVRAPCGADTDKQ